MARLVQKRKQIDPKTLRKHSHIMEKSVDPLLIVGDRKQTDYGYDISGHEGKSFETGYMVVMPGATTPTWRHLKKTRVYRVLAGSGYYQVQQSADLDAPIENRALAAGDEVVAAPGEVHRLTSQSVKLEVYFTQDSKYKANLEEVKPVEQVAEVPVDELIALSEDEKRIRRNTTTAPSRRSRRSRAREQIAAMRGDRGGVDRAQQQAQRGENFFRTGEAGVNAMPVSDLSEEGAG